MKNNYKSVANNGNFYRWDEAPRKKNPYSKNWKDLIKLNKKDPEVRKMLSELMNKK